MQHSKSRSKLLASCVIDTICSVAYFALAIACVVVGAILVNADPTEIENSAAGVFQQGMETVAVGILGAVAIVLGIFCLVAFAISLVGTVTTLKSVNKCVADLKTYSKKITVASAFNYAAMAIFLVGAIYDFANVGSDKSLIAGACTCLVVGLFRGVSAVLKTLAVNKIKFEEVAQPQVSNEQSGEENE